MKTQRYPALHREHVHSLCKVRNKKAVRGDLQTADQRVRDGGCEKREVRICRISCSCSRCWVVPTTEDDRSYQASSLDSGTLKRNICQRTKYIISLKLRWICCKKWLENNGRQTLAKEPKRVNRKNGYSRLEIVVGMHLPFPHKHSRLESLIPRQSNRQPLRSSCFSSNSNRQPLRSSCFSSNSNRQPLRSSCFSSNSNRSVSREQCSNIPLGLVIPCIDCYSSSVLAWC